MVEAELRAVWRDAVLDQLPDDGARILVASDPDRLLLDADVLSGLAERQIDLVTFADPIVFRLEYETRYRDRSESPRLLVRTDEREVKQIPYDVLRASASFDVNLATLLPGLSYPVAGQVTGLDRVLLYQAARDHTAPAVLGDDATKDFILRHVYGVSTELISTPAQLLAALIRLHYQDRQIPSAVVQRFESVLSRQAVFAGWPVRDLVLRRETFLSFLQERWERRIAAAQGLSLPPLKHDGPPELPFEAPDVRVQLDNLFAEGLLQPVECDAEAVSSAPWMSFGVVTDAAGEHRRQIDGLLDRIVTDLPGADVGYQEWLLFARKWAELCRLRCDPAHPAAEGPDGGKPDDLQARVDAAFQDWLQRRYSSLYSHPPCPPVMVHHVPHAMAHELSAARRMALLVVDGLAYAQWLAVHAELWKSGLLEGVTEQAAFAWIPTLTSVSRQAIFSGRAPLYFGSSIQTTNKEPDLWREFWTDQGVARKEVGYAKGLGNLDDLQAVMELSAAPQIRVLGLVVDTVDSMMHGEVLGERGLHAHVRQWLRTGYLQALLQGLLSHGYTVVLTSDHGNLEACGVGRPAQEGVLADVRGQRARVYPDESLRQQVHEQFMSAWPWPPVGLPATCFPLLAGGRTAFTTSGSRVVSHGGASLEEVVVPVVWWHPEGARP